MKHQLESYVPSAQHFLACYTITHFDKISVDAERGNISAAVRGLFNGLSIFYYASIYFILFRFP